MLVHRRGLKGFVSAAGGGVYLIGLNLQTRFFEVISELDWGRRILASLDTRRLVRTRAQQPEAGEPVAAELRDRLIAGPAELVEKIARREFARLVDLVNRGQGDIAVIIAERGGGKTNFLQRLASKFDDQVLIIDCPVEGYQAFREIFAKALDLNATEDSPEAFGRRLMQSKIRVVALDNVHRLFRPMKGGQKEWVQVSKLIRAITDKLVWIITVDRAAWQYVNLMRGKHLFLGEVLELPQLTEEQLGDLIDLTFNEADIDPDLTKLALPRQTDSTGEETVAERCRLQFIRFLWNASDGNPSVALRFLAKSLRTQEDGCIAAWLPELPPLSELERLGTTGQLVLRVMTQCELASPEEITQSLRLSEEEVKAAIAALHLHGWIEEQEGRYRITWSWWRAITRVLARKNLLPQSLSGVRP